MATITKTVEQLQAELKAAQEALAEVERKKQEEIREAKYAEQRAKEEEANAKRAAEVKPWIEAVAFALHDAGVAAVHPQPWGIMIGTDSYPDPDLQISVEREEHSSGGRMYCFRTSYTGRYILTVGNTYRDFPRVRYPSKKAIKENEASGFNVAKIVATVTERIEQKAAKIKREQEKARAAQNATELAAQVSKDLGYTDKYSNPVSGTQVHSRQRGGRGSGYEYSTYEAPKGRVYYTVGTLAVTPEQARVLHDALVAIRAMKPKKEPA